MNETRSLKHLAQRIRAHSVRMTHRGKAAHVGSCLSIADILAALYGETLRVDPTNPRDKSRDRFIMSKGHAAAALYGALAESGFFPIEWLETHYQDGSLLCGHVTTHELPGVELSTGSLGHGLSVGTGMALTAKLDGHAWSVWVLLSDGECDEGSVWEPALFAPFHELDNLNVVVDYNKIQSLDLVERTLALEPFADKWRAFGWHVEEIDGHDVDAMAELFARAPLEHGKPTCFIAHTVKGRGVSFMERSVAWHYKSPTEDELAAALAEIGAS